MLATGRGRADAEEKNKPAPPSSRSGKSGARFQVLEKIGEGSQWAAYRVQEKGSNASHGTLALKALKPAANRHPRLSKVMCDIVDEWKVLDHPALARPRDCGQEQGTFFITTDYLSGGSLATALARGPLDPGDALEVLRQLCAPLAYLHAQNRAHGDVRPRQILFDAAGHACLTDGGLADALSRAGLALADCHPDAAFYMAPERSAGATLAPSADIYSLGTTFYRMLTGRVPFEGNAALTVAARHRTEVPAPPSQFNARIPASLDALTLQLLDKNPATRPTITDLERVLAQPNTAVAPTKRAPKAAPAVAPAPIPPAPQIAPEDAPQVTVPKRRPIDTVVEETIQMEAAEKSVRDVKVARRKHRRREFWGMFGAIFFLLLLIGTGIGGAYGAYYYWVEESPKTVTVPNYLGQTQDSAKQTLAKAGLYMRVVRETYDTKVATGTVMEGDPQPGRHVRAKREVEVTISAGEAPIKMLDFSNLTLNQARAIILQHGMRLGPIADQYHDTVPRGGICGQYPEPNEPFRRSEPITLIVSRGPQPTEIDGTTGNVMDTTPLIPEVNDPSQGDPSLNPENDFTPMESAGNSASPDSPSSKVKLETKVAIAKVSIPKNGGAQVVRIVVHDANGERVVYQKVNPAGTRIRQRVSVTRPADQQADIQIFVGDTLVKDEQL